jgi:hypothetical protein
MVQQCQYVAPDGVPCFDDAQDGRELCVWHDAAVDKSGPDWAPRLEALARDGQSMAGFELARAQLDGISLTFPEHEKGADLRFANLQRANLKGARLYRADFTGAFLLKANLSDANLNAARFEDADLLGASFSGVHMEDTDWGKALRQDREAYAAEARGHHDLAAQNFREAEEIYRDLRITSEAQGHRRISGEFFYREMLMRHHRLPRFSMARFVSRFAHILYGYGERPTYIISFALGYMALFGVIYFLTGVHDMGVLDIYDPAKSLADNLSTFGNCLYFSIVTFTTVGYGDIVPAGATKAIAAFEALSGSFIMALFVVVFVRKLAR